MLLLLLNQPATGFDGTVNTSQAQGVTATASTTVTATASTAQAQTVAASDSGAVTGTASTSQGQTASATAATSVTATGATRQAQRVNATGATSVTGTAATGQGQSVTGLSSPATAQPDKRGGDDVPREEHWERRKPDPKRDATLDAVIQQAYDKSIGREVAKPVQVVNAFDYESDDEDVLMLMMD